MLHVPEFYPDISLKLSSVLEEIGVDERMVLKRRRTWLLQETVNNISWRLRGFPTSCYYFGSQSEGTTTPGLKSDTDNLICNHDHSVIQDWGEWEPGIINLLMIQEETTPPGYCLLQLLHSNMPTTVIDKHSVKYRGDKVLLKNTSVKSVYHQYGYDTNGPAGTDLTEGFCDNDFVHAYPLKRMPEFLVSWLQQQTQQGKLSQEMMRYIESNPCYVVPVGRNDSSFEEVEWRISFSHAERCVMFNLNITQLQCFVLLKLILKTHLKHHHEKGLSSFMCKNVLLLCIEKTHPRIWSPQNLLSIFTFCLLQLKRCIQREYCPHFIIQENNLMAGKLKPEVKIQLLEKIQVIYETHCCAILDVKIDDIGLKLVNRLNRPRNFILRRDILKDQYIYISGDLLYNLARNVSSQHMRLLETIISGKNSFTVIITTLVQHNHQGGQLEQAASGLLTPLVCSSLGSVIASRNIHQHHSVSPEALTWLSLGLNSDAASSKLKLASVYYCVGDFYTTIHILSSIEETYEPNLVEACCFCYAQGKFFIPNDFERYADTHNEFAIRHIVAFCVRFLPDEFHCQPQELQYEMFRSTLEERAKRDESQDFWMDWAVVDSLPYLYFLQYKTYGHLQRYGKQQQALNNLVRSLDKDFNYRHKETALNLLGQCYQQENRHTEALHCYRESLNIRPTNNAARLHISNLNISRLKTDSRVCPNCLTKNRTIYFSLSILMIVVVCLLATVIYLSTIKK